jgi:hypothetical protein
MIDSTVATLSLVVMAVTIDIAMPTMYSVFSANMRSPRAGALSKSRYRKVSFPRTLLLAIIIASIVFAPTGAENSRMFLIAFVVVSIAYIVFAIVDVRKALGD